MSPHSRGAKRVTHAIASPSSLQHICSSCLQTLSRRSYASAATAKASIDSSSLPINQLSPSASTAAQPAYTIKAGIVVSRPPLLTPDPHPFETAYYLYQRRLNERLVLPFTQYFYYRRNTPAFEHWRKHRRERNGTAARDIGPYSAYTKESWNDEVLVGDETGRPDKIVETLISEEGRQGEFTGKGDSKYAGLRRTTEADETEDTKSLQRRLQRTLYLLVKTKGPDRKKGDGEAEKSEWKFPSGSVVGFEGLREAAQRILFSSLGPNMNTFFVGNHPVGHYIARFSSPRPSSSASQRYIPDRSSASTTSSTTPQLDSTAKTTTQVESTNGSIAETLLAGEKTFFMKARIMAGQADLTMSSPATSSADAKDPASGVEQSSAQAEKDMAVDLQLDQIEDFKWLSKDEVERAVHPDYWRHVRHMLVAQ